MAPDALAPPAELFRPPTALRHRHLQSVLGSIPPRTWLMGRRARALRAGAEPWIIECGAGVRLLALYTPPLQSARTVRVAVLLHGWEGSAESSYVLSLGSLLYGAGYGVLRLNLRDHGPTQQLNRELFHSCRLAEVVGAIKQVSARFAPAPLYLAGFSLGGNFMLRVASVADPPPRIARVVAISPVIDPAATLRVLEEGWYAYRRHFVRKWSRSLRIKQRLWPEQHDFDELLATADLRAMTAGLVERYTEFPDLETYLHGYALTGERLATLHAPADLLLAEDDPIIPVGDAARIAAVPALQIFRARFGGHCGFIESITGPTYADRFVLARFGRPD